VTQAAMTMLNTGWPKTLCHSERVKAGMARAKAQGKRISQAPIAKPVQDCIAELHAQGFSIQQIRKRLRMAYGTAWNYVQRLKAPAGGTQ
jgi:DNA invertase Pin-like site-specific DNA recombinase